MKTKNTRYGRAALCVSARRVTSLSTAVVSFTFYRLVPAGHCRQRALPLPPGEVSRSDGEGAFLTEEGGKLSGLTEGVNSVFFYSPRMLLSHSTRLVPAGHPCLSLRERCHEVTERVPSFLSKAAPEGKDGRSQLHLFLFSADAAFTFYTPRAGGAHPLPGAAKDAKRP